MKKIVIIGANDFQNRLILKAKELGYETHVFAWQCGDIGETTADYFYPVSIVEKEQILEECKKIKPVGICSIASDLATTTVTYVADNLGLPCNKFKDNFIQTNKYAMRSAMNEAGVSCPKFYKATPENNTDEIDISYPAIVKPTDRSGSRSIWKIHDKSELLEAINDACESSFEGCAIIEEYIDGPEYSCECISYKGEHTFLQLTKKHTTGAPHFIETGHEAPSDIPEKLHEGIKNEIFKALDALNIMNGASHTEFRLQPDGSIRIIEIGARMGGDCIGSDLVELSTGYDFIKMVIDTACGNAPDFTKNEKTYKAKINFMFTTDDVNKMREHEKKNKDNIYRISDLDMENAGNVTDSSNRIGYYITVK